MEDSQDINHILKDWAFDPFKVNVRRLSLDDREVLQMRIDLGILQLEIDDRPDGFRPDGEPTYFQLMQRRAEASDGEFTLGEEECLQIDREFVQFYNRRVCWLQLKEFERAVGDADHTLGLMDFCEQHSPDESWTVSHEQYRPFVLYHRTQAAALAKLQPEDENNINPEDHPSEAAEAAIEEINTGLDQLEKLFNKYGAAERFEEDELVKRLTEFRDSLRKKFDIGKTLDEQLNEAIANEQYERAAVIRDLIRRKSE